MSVCRLVGPTHEIRNAGRQLCACVRTARTHKDRKCTQVPKKNNNMIDYRKTQVKCSSSLSIPIKDLQSSQRSMGVRYGT